MKTFCKITMIVVFLLFCTNGIQAQTTQPKFNQVELFKQYVGTWKGEMGKDTTFLMEMKSFYDAFECYLKTETKGKIIIEEKTVIGYDKKNDKLIESAILNSSPDIMIGAIWFISKNKCEQVLLEDISNPEKAIFKWTFELPSPDLFIWTNIKNNKTTGTYTFHREK
jgi:AAA+ superfamily predicted ATPase